MNTSLPLPNLLSQGVAYHSALLMFSIFSLRYVFFASLMFSLAARRHGRPALAHAIPPSKRQIKHEVAYSFLSIAVMTTIVTSILYGFGWIAHSRLYGQVSEYGWTWFFISIPIMLIIHDTLFYWLHRLIHVRALFRHIHRVHHLSRYPTAWAAFSFHPLEAVLEALIVVCIIFMLPVHPFAFFIFQIISTLLNAYGHCGREFSTSGWRQHWLSRWINTPTAHSIHHDLARHNYGLYFLFWDRLMGTLQE
ncbi:MAG: sterol desaturase family protein [Pseudomonadota bacterium]